MHGARTVSVHRRAGLGDLLLSTCAAWRFARATQRTLVIDWRGTSYTTRPHENLFPTLFEPLTQWCGVPVHVARNDEPFPPVVPTNAAEEALDGRAACDVVLSGGDVALDHLRWWGCLAPARPNNQQMAELLRALRPLPHLADAIAGGEAAMLGTGPSIGVHLRHGNGGDIMNHNSFWADGLAVHRVVTTLKRIQAVLGNDTPVFLATDSSEVRGAMRALVPAVRCIDVPFRPVGDGELHLWRDASAALEATFVEMFLLARTTVLVRMPPASYFSAPAAFLKEPAPAELLARRPNGLEPTVW